MAIEETKAVGQIAQMVSDVTQFVDRVIGKPLEQMGLYLGDTIEFYRYRHLLKLRDKVDAIHQQRKLRGKIRQIELRHAIPLLDYASREDDELLQDMWARLIADATDPDKLFDLKKILIEVLGSFEPLDAKILMRIGGKRFRQVTPSLRGIVKDLGVPEPDARLSLQNLVRLRCITYKSSHDFLFPMDDLRDRDGKFDPSVAVSVIERLWDTVKKQHDLQDLNDDVAYFTVTPLGESIIGLTTADDGPSGGITHST
jgi:hypothetical protein